MKRKIFNTQVRLRLLLVCSTFAAIAMFSQGCDEDEADQVPSEEFPFVFRTFDGTESDGVTPLMMIRDLIETNSIVIMGNFDNNGQPANISHLLEYSPNRSYVVGLTLKENPISADRYVGDYLYTMDAYTGQRNPFVLRLKPLSNNELQVELHYYYWEQDTSTVYAATRITDVNGTYSYQYLRLGESLEADPYKAVLDRPDYGHVSLRWLESLKGNNQSLSEIFDLSGKTEEELNAAAFPIVPLVALAGVAVVIKFRDDIQTFFKDEILSDAPETGDDALDNFMNWLQSSCGTLTGGKQEDENESCYPPVSDEMNFATPAPVSATRYDCVNNNCAVVEGGAYASMQACVDAGACFGQTFTDPRDGEVYKIVEIGSQIWFAENLRFTGGLVQGPTSGSGLEEPAYYNPSTSYATAGKFYNRSAAFDADLCPSGWRIPSREDWNALEVSLGMDPALADSSHGFRGTNHGSKMAANASTFSGPSWGWSGSIISGSPEFDSSGFKGLPIGRMTWNGHQEMGSLASWWSSTPIPNNANFRWVVSLYETKRGVEITTINELISISCRCVKN